MHSKSESKFPYESHWVILLLLLSFLWSSIMIIIKSLLLGLKIVIATDSKFIICQGAKVHNCSLFPLSSLPILFPFNARTQEKVRLTNQTYSMKQKKKRQRKKTEKRERRWPRAGKMQEWGEELISRGDREQRRLIVTTDHNMSGYENRNYSQRHVSQAAREHTHAHTTANWWTQPNGNCHVSLCTAVLFW